MSRYLIAHQLEQTRFFAVSISEVIPMIYEPITQNDTRQADDVDKQRKSLSLKACIAMLTSLKQVVSPIHSKSTQKSDSRLSFGNSHTSGCNFVLQNRVRLAPHELSRKKTTAKME